METNEVRNRRRFPRLCAWAALGLSLAVASTGCSPVAPLRAAAAVYVRDVSGGTFDTTPVRGVRGPLRLHQDGDAFECSSCHSGFTGDQGDAALQGAHSGITFDHGLNLLCLNCHHPTNSDAFVYHDGSEIPGDEPTRLCAKCHGPHYREWLIGVHGRRNGAWDPKRGEQKKLDCIQCHDPHRPRFQPLTPQPPPVLTRFDRVATQEDSHGK